MTGQSLPCLQMSFEFFQGICMRTPRRWMTGRLRPRPFCDARENSQHEIWLPHPGG